MNGTIGRLATALADRHGVEREPATPSYHHAADEPAPALAPPDCTRVAGHTCCTGFPAVNPRRAFRAAT